MTNTNLIIQISLLYLCYFLGYFRYALAWVILPIVLIVVRHIKTKRLTRKKDFIRDLANKAEKDVVLDAIDGLPSWMQRRHLEKDEWVNEIIKRLWNNVNNYVHNFIKKSLEKGLNKKAGKYGFSGLTVEKLIVGSVPFRVGRLEVLKNGIEDEIILDMDVLYDGNCDIMVKFSKFAASLKDFQMYGRLRMILKPLIDQFPLVGGCQIFFLNPPEVNFSLNGFAGILELPLFNYILKTAVLDIICSTIVLPNKYLIQLSKLVSKEHIQFLRPKESEKSDDNVDDKNDNEDDDDYDEAVDEQSPTEIFDQCFSSLTEILRYIEQQPAETMVEILSTLISEKTL
ncbi:extended synaptotagmin-2-like isoform X2 [Euwallacea similis]|uniref:extended synaptotagmin-2-like isoform X2 n=1 Tax=Euwallacea similis TaxID=1736056 RepID=UPI00344C62BF